jgi:hypothetical protein
MQLILYVTRVKELQLVPLIHSRARYRVTTWARSTPQGTVAQICRGYLGTLLLGRRICSQKTSPMADCHDTPARRGLEQPDEMRGRSPEAEREAHWDSPWFRVRLLPLLDWGLHASRVDT